MIISITLLYWLSVSVRHWGSVTLYSYQMVVTLLSLPIVLLSPHLSTGYIIGAVFSYHQYSDTGVYAALVCNLALPSEDNSVEVQFSMEKGLRLKG